MATAAVVVVVVAAADIAARLPWYSCCIAVLASGTNMPPLAPLPLRSGLAGTFEADDEAGAEISLDPAGVGARTRLAVVAAVAAVAGRTSAAASRGTGL